MILFIQVCHEVIKMLPFAFIDGTMTLQTVARVVENTVMYINGETNSTVWPGWSVMSQQSIAVCGTLRLGVLSLQRAQDFLQS